MSTISDRGERLGSEDGYCRIVHLSMSAEEVSSGLNKNCNMTGPDITIINFDTEAPVSSLPHKSCNQSGTALKEHDYIGLSEVSSNGPPVKHAEKGRREVLNLNLSATELRLGPPETLESSRNSKEDDEEPSFHVGHKARNNGCNQAPDQAADKEAEASVPQEASSIEKFSEGALYVSHQEQGNIIEMSKTEGVIPEDNESAGAGTTEGSSPPGPASSQVETEPRYLKESPAHNLLGSLQQSSILQEFRMAQAMKAAADAQHAQVMKAAAEENLRSANRPLPHGPQDFENGHKNGLPNDGHAYPVSLMMFPGAKYNGVKRAFTEAMGSSCEGQVGANLTSNLAGSGNEVLDVKAMSQPGYPWNSAPPPSIHSFNPKCWHNMGLEKSNGSFGPFPTPQRLARGHLLNIRQGDVPDASSPNAGSAEVNKHVVKEPVAAASLPQQTVGWPPVRSFRRNQDFARPAPPPLAPGSTSLSGQGQVNISMQTTSNSWFVKIYMDGVPIGRKVDLKTNNSYEKLYSTLEEMFHRFLNGQFSASQSSTVGESPMLASSRKLNFLHGSEYVLIYEDQEKDFMLVGDVPWQMFISTVKRLRIMKGSETVNLAPRGGDKLKAQTAVA